jgi:hypothetical protein
METKVALCDYSETCNNHQCNCFGTLTLAPETWNHLRNSPGVLMSTADFMKCRCNHRNNEIVTIRYEAKPAGDAGCESIW